MKRKESIRPLITTHLGIIASRNKTRNGFDPTEAVMIRGKGKGKGGRGAFLDTTHAIGFNLALCPKTRNCVMLIP